MFTGRSRWTPFVVSLSFAAVFIGLRVCYRLLFGSFSWLAVGQAVQVALPFAALIVICGFLSSLVDFRKVLVNLSALKYSRSVGTALSIALASFPTLLVEVKRMNTYRRLRGIRSRFAVVVPVLEHTVEKSVALAAAMELKGFGSSEQQQTFECVPINFMNYSLTLSGREVLHEVNFNLSAGSVTVLTGPTGSGKTSLLESIAGLSQHFHAGRTSSSLALGTLDRLAIPPRNTAHCIGFVPQQVRLSFTASTAREELDFTLRLQGVPRAEIATRVADLLNEFGMDAYADAPLEHLSAGQATRLAIASAVSTTPQILLLDEPLADLDRISTAAVIALLEQLSSSGITIVVAEHHTAPLEALKPQWLQVDSGQVSEGKWTSDSVAFPARTIPVVGHEDIVQVSSLEVAHGDNVLIENVSFTAHTGEIIALTGPNGVGKSSLLTALNSVVTSDSVLIAGKDISTLKPGSRVSSVASVPEEVASLFVTESLAEELAFGDKLAGVPEGLSALTFRSLLSLGDHISPELAATHPRNLSAGTQLALALALQLSWKPALITIDEPTRGMDPHAREATAEVLRCVAETGTVVLFATHDHQFAQSLNARLLTIENQKLVSAKKVSA